MIKKVKKIIYPFAKLAFKTFHLKERSYTYDGITVNMNSEVFPPHFTISTKIILDYIKPLNLKNKRVLELGCGSGIISLLAAKKDAITTASDINTTAIEALKKASTNNTLKVNVIYSDLFENLKHESLFDYIIINPPYYPKEPKNIKERAWFCGENFEYFEKLFSQLKQHLATNTWMILSEDYDIEHIKTIAKKNGLSFELIFQKNVVKEKNYIFNIINE